MGIDIIIQLMCVALLMWTLLLMHEEPSVNADPRAAENFGIPPGVASRFLP